jgi:beige protein homolog 1
MSAHLRRHRSATASTPPPVTESSTALETSLEQLSSALRKYSEFRSADISKLVAQTQLLRQCLNGSPESVGPKDAFRHLHGFSALLNTLRAVSGYYHPSKRAQGEREKLFELLGNILGILSDVFRDHQGNRRYFKRRVEGGGWAALEQAIASIGFGGSDSDPWSENRLFGLLLSFATGNEALKSLFSDTQDQQTLDIYGQNGPEVDELLLTSKVSDVKNRSSSENESEVSDSYLLVHQVDDLKFAAFADKRVQEALDENTMLYNIDIVPTIVSFWKTLPRGRRLPDAPASLLIILALSKVSSFSKSNLLALHSTGVLSVILPFAFEDNASLSACERQAAENLCSSLMCLGMSTLNDARYLLRSTSSKARDIFLRMIQMSNRPSHIHFNLSLNGFASVELPTLGRSFPPSSAAGYTFMAWICIDQFDNNTHTTIFGAFDSSQTCFVLAYLEKDTHNFILQTSVTSSRPSVRFKSAVFRERRWYHIAMVHRRPRTMTSSKAALYVNGEFAEQVKCQYPACPPPSNSSTDSFASFASSSSTKLNPVQAFLGTPQDLSPRLGRGLVFSRWSLASAHLFEDALSDDLIAVYYGLGPRYNGNFQDCLGSFQTYEASAALGMRNELMHPGKDEKSDILAAIRDKASVLLPESRILLSIFPAAVLGDDLSSESEASQLIRGLSRNASSNLFQLTRNTSTSVAINVAVPSINDALTRVNGTAVLTGDPAVIIPHSIDDTMWRLGGCVAIGLKLIEEAVFRPDIVRAVEILFESVKSSWRNSEAMERENGYSILGALIRGKVGAGAVITSSGANADSSSLSSSEREKLSFELLSLVLGFLGYNHENPENSILNNPLAYRTLIVDFDMWRKAAILTQGLYYNQFIVFSVTSKYHVFNSRRLIRMRMIPFGMRNSHR